MLESRHSYPTSRRSQLAVMAKASLPILTCMNDLKIAVIGAGRHASANLHPAIPLSGARICCVLTRSIASARRAAVTLGAECYYDHIDNMLDNETLDAAIISVEPEDQAALTIRCLRRGQPTCVTTLFFN